MFSQVQCMKSGNAGKLPATQKYIKWLNTLVLSVVLCFSGPWISCNFPGSLNSCKYTNIWGCERCFLCTYLFRSVYARSWPLGPGSRPAIPHDGDGAGCSRDGLGMGVKVASGWSSPCGGVAFPLWKRSPEKGRGRMSPSLKHDRL